MLAPAGRTWPDFRALRIDFQRLPTASLAELLAAERAHAALDPSLPLLLSVADLPVVVPLPSCSGCGTAPSCSLSTAALAAAARAVPRGMVRPGGHTSTGHACTACVALSTAARAAAEAALREPGSKSATEQTSTCAPLPPPAAATTAASNAHPAITTDTAEQGAQAIGQHETNAAHGTATPAPAPRLCGVSAAPPSADAVANLVTKAGKLVRGLSNEEIEDALRAANFNFSRAVEALRARLLAVSSSKRHPHKRQRAGAHESPGQARIIEECDSGAAITAPRTFPSSFAIRPAGSGKPVAQPWFSMTPRPRKRSVSGAENGAESHADQLPSASQVSGGYGHLSSSVPLSVPSPGDRGASAAATSSSPTNRRRGGGDGGDDTQRGGSSQDSSGSGTRIVPREQAAARRAETPTAGGTQPESSSTPPDPLATEVRGSGSAPVISSPQGHPVPPVLVPSDIVTPSTLRSHELGPMAAPVGRMPRRVVMAVFDDEMEEPAIVRARAAGFTVSNGHGNGAAGAVEAHSAHHAAESGSDTEEPSASDADFN